MVQFGAVGCRILQVSVGWWRLVKVGDNWCRLKQDGAGNAFFCRSVQNGADWCRMVHVVVGWFRIV